MPTARRDNEGLKIRIGRWFEASATGRFGMVIIAALWCSLLVAKAIGWL